jgi:hypothetical protein
MGTLTNDGNWVDGCFEWYQSKGGQNENTKKFYLNQKSSDPDNGDIGGNRVCSGVAAELPERLLPSNNAFPLRTHTHTHTPTRTHPPARARTHTRPGPPRPLQTNGPPCRPALPLAEVAGLSALAAVVG